MAKKNNGCWIYVITFGLVIVVFMAIDGSLGYLLSFISIPIILIALISYFSPDKKENKLDGSTEKFNQVTPKKTNKTFKPQPFKYNMKELVGRIEGETLPNEIKDISDLKFLQLSTIQPVEISDFLNQNLNIRYLSLTGPFWFKNNIKPTLFHLTIKSNDNIYTIIRQCSNLHQLQLLELHFKSLKLEEIIESCKSIKNLTLRVNLVEFPNEVFDLPHLQYLDISHNKIEKISEENIRNNSLPNTKLQTINLSFNRLKTVPTFLFRLNSGIKINLKENPIKTRILKRLYREYSDEIWLSYDQIEIARRTFHPQTWLFFKIVICLSIIMAPYILADSWAFSFLLTIFVITSWRTIFTN